MACICIQIKERVEREKKRRTSRKKRWETPLYGSSEKSHGRQSVRNEWREIFLEKVKGSYLRRMKKENGKWKSFKLKSPKELETSEKPNSPTRKNINSINQNMPRGHGPRSATTYLIQHSIPRVIKNFKKKKNFSSSMVVMGFPDDQRIGGQLTGLTR